MHFDGPWIAQCNKRREPKQKNVATRKVNEAKADSRTALGRRTNTRTTRDGRKCSRNRRSTKKRGAAMTGRDYNFKSRSITKPPGGRSTLHLTHDDNPKDRVQSNDVARGGGARAIQQLRKRDVSRLPQDEEEDYGSLDDRLEGDHTYSNVGENCSNMICSKMDVDEEESHEGDVRVESYRSFDPYSSAIDGQNVLTVHESGENITFNAEDVGYRETSRTSRRLNRNCEGENRSSNVSSNVFARGNRYNAITDRSSTRRIKPPGGMSTLKFY